MALVRVQMRLLCATQADAIQVRDSVAQKLATKVLKTVHAAPAVVTVRGRWVVTADASFQLRADADDVYADAQAKWTSGGLRNKILTGSTAMLHVCNHAEGETNPPDCRSVELQLATKG